MLVIFDMDGTLIGGETFDWASFDAALESAGDFVPTAGFWESLEEVTARAIVHTALRARSAQERERLEQSIQQAYLARLRQARQEHPGAFRPIAGAPELLRELRRRPGVSVAIATGDWAPSATFKLAAAGLEVEGIPFASCTDRHRRVDIIALAAERAGRSLEEAVYVGDGPWDYRACQKLGIPFIGTGAGTERLRAAGARHILTELWPEPFFALADQLLKTKRARRG
jgi:phosphoglycolate phosphatase-like HAD superfamily hydrolase